MTPLDCALAYARRLNWPVFPRPNGRFIKGGHGWHDATTDPAQIREWWNEYPGALIATPTGHPSGIVILDIDVKNGKDGFAAISRMGYPLGFMPTPIVLTPSGGWHCYYALSPEVPVRTTVSELGDGLDVLSDGTSVALPTPGYRYRWDKPNNLDNTPMLPATAWLDVPRPPAELPPRPIKPARGLSPYADAALARACEMIRYAPGGQQHDTLIRQSFSIGTLAGAGGIPDGVARRCLINAGCQMEKTKPRPWGYSAVKRVVDACFNAGLRHPRPTRRER